ncbi:unnamed protein product [Prunus armeniaca]
MVDIRPTKSNATMTGQSHGFVVETSMQPHRIVAANTLQHSPSALQPPSVVGIAEQPPQTAAGIVEQPLHDPETSTALQPQASISGAALTHYPAVRAHQQPPHSVAKIAAQPHGYFDTIPVLEQIHSLPPLQPHLMYAPVYESNEALSHMWLGPMHTTLLNPHSQVHFNSQVDQLTQRVDDQNNLIGQLLR